MRRFQAMVFGFLTAVSAALALSCAVQNGPAAPGKPGAGPAPAQPRAEKSDRRDMDYLGPVHSVHWEIARFGVHEGVRVEEQRTFLRMHLFNVQGNLIESNTDYERLVKEYDAEGRVSKESSYRASKLETTALYSYDDKGRVSLVEVNDAKGLLGERMAYTYDEAGRLKEKVTSSPGKSMEYHWLYVYDAAGRVVEESVRTVTSPGEAVSQGEIEQKTQYEYDKAGHKVKEVFFNGPQTPATVTEYLNSPSGDVLEETMSQFDKNGKLALTTHEGYKMPGAPVKSEDTQYDPKGNVLIASETTYTYEFDSYGNWTKQTMFYRQSKGGATDMGEPQPVQSAYRTFIYYTIQ